MTRAHDWSKSPLGASGSWPQSLRTAAGLVLAAKVPMFLAWGPDLALVYNDAYTEILGAKHPALGLPLAEVWAEVWPHVSGLIGATLSGEASHHENLRLVVNRRGADEPAWFSFSYTPLRDESGEVAGIFCVVAETTTQMQSEHRKEEERQRLARLFEQAPGFVAILRGPEHAFEFVNEAYDRMFGRRGFVGETVRGAFPELDGQGFYELLDGVYATGERFIASSMPIRLQATPGAEPTDRFLDFIYEPVRGDGGAVTGIFVEGYDVTERMRAEAAVRESEVRHRFRVELSDALSGLTSPSEIMATVARRLGPHLGVDQANYYLVAGDRFVVTDEWRSPASPGMLGNHRLADFGEGAVAGLRAGEILRLDDTRTVEGSQAFMAAGMAAVLSVPLRRGDGWAAGLHIHQAEPRVWTDGEEALVREVAVHAWEAVERARAEAELRVLNDTLETHVTERTAERDRMWETSPDLLVVLGFDGVFRRVNPAWTVILGYREGELVGTRVDRLVHPDDIALTERALADATGGPLPTVENRYRHEDGSYRCISWRTSSPENGLIYATGRDVTAERERQAELEVAQEALRQAQKMEAVGQLTGGVAHDFNNLLTVIKSSTDLLKRPNLPEERRVRYVGAISDTVDRAARLTGQLLAFARRQALRPEVFDAGRRIQALGEMLGTITGSRIAISLNLPDEMCCVNADPSQFDTALVNMAVNARDAMDGEGTLTLTVWPVERMPAIRSHQAVAGDFVAVSVSDTGSGIPPEVVERIFEPFFTTKGVGQGTGLGLSQVFGFAKQSGGEITVESEVGRGSTFTLYLPRAVGDTQGTDHPEPEALIDGHGTVVLVVEDNVDVGTFATQTLADLGYHTVWAANADEALAELAGDAHRFDVVFSDVVMPGMSGIELGQEIRRRHPDLPVVLTSGYSHVLAADGTSGFELLQKPYSVEDLSRVLRTAAGWRRRERLLDP